MFVCVARITLDIPAANSLKAKRQVVRRVSDRVKAKFNVSVAEVDDNELWQRASMGFAVVGNERRHVNEQMDKILQFIEDMYVAPVSHRELEIVSFGGELFGGGSGHLPIESGQRSLAEAEGMGDWERRHERRPESGEAQHPPASSPRGKDARAPRKTSSSPGVSLEEARVKARRLRNRRDWERE
jgi:uncharacterized protein